jgi:hypothetical protein
LTYVQSPFNHSSITVLSQFDHCSPLSRLLLGDRQPPVPSRSAIVCVEVDQRLMQAKVMRRGGKVTAVISSRPLSQWLRDTGLPA